MGREHLEQVWAVLWMIDSGAVEPLDPDALEWLVQHQFVTLRGGTHRLTAKGRVAYTALERCDGEVEGR